MASKRHIVSVKGVIRFLTFNWNHSPRMIRYVLLVRSMPNVITFLYVQQMSIHNKINGQTNEAWVSCGNDFPHLLKAVEKSDKKRLIQRSQILWHKRRDSEAPTLHQKKQRERERERDFRLIKNASRIPKQGQRFPRPTFF